MMRRVVAVMAGGLVLLVAMAAGWLVLASRAFVWIAGLSAYFPSPWSTWWLYATQPHPDRLTKAYLAISGVVGAIPVVVLLILAVCMLRPARKLTRPFGGGLKPLASGVTDNHGHAAWATPGQIKRRFAGPGCLIGAMDRSPSSPLLFDDLADGPGHSIIIAGPGSRKSTTAITRIWHWQGPRVVFDPSLEIGPIMAPAFRGRGCNVVTIGPASGGVNVLDWIDVEHPEADAHIRTAIDWVYDENASAKGDSVPRDPFFSKWGRSLVTCLAAHMLYSEDEDAPKSLAALRLGVATPEADMQSLLARIHKTSNSSMARDIAGGLMQMKAEETFSSIYSNAFQATEWLSVRVYADAVSGSAIRTADILNSNTVVFVQVPLRTMLTTPALGRAMMGAFFNALFQADGQDFDNTVLFQIDEAWTLGPMKEIKLFHTTARKYRGAISTIWQSEGQIESVWGKDDAKMLRDTVSWRSYNAIQDGDVAEKLSRDIGEHAVMAWSEGSNRGTSRGSGSSSGSRSRGDNSSTHEIKRRLIKADEIMRAPADEMFVLARNFPHPIRCVAAPYFLYPELAQRMGRNRFARVPQSSKGVLIDA